MDGKPTLYSGIPIYSPKSYGTTTLSSLREKCIGVARRVSREDVLKVVEPVTLRKSSTVGNDTRVRNSGKVWGAGLETSLESLDPSKRMDRGLARIWDNVRGGEKVRELKREGRKWRISFTDSFFHIYRRFLNLV